MTVIYKTMTDAYRDIIGYVISAGKAVEVSGQPTLEVLDVSFALENAVNAGVPIGIGRKVGPKAMAIDGFGNLAGASFPSVFLATGPFLERFADVIDDDTPQIVKHRANTPANDGRYFQGQYGPRMDASLRLVEKELRRDPASRRGVVNLWDYRTDFDPKYKDRPCTTQVQFIIRDQKLLCFVTMRSNDLWTGTAYDCWQFGQLQAALAHVLGIPVGMYYHRATSLHIYTRDLPRLQEIARTYEHVPNERETPGPDWETLPPGTYKSMTDVQNAFYQLGVYLSIGLRPKGSNHIENWYLSYLKENPNAANR